MSIRTRQLPYIPSKQPNTNNPMQYWCISPDGEGKRITRQTFSDLVKTAEIPAQYVYLDINGGHVYFFVAPSEEQRIANQQFCNEYLRNYQRERVAQNWCMYMRTTKCDGWMKGADGHKRCEVCPFANQSRWFSLDTPYGGTDTDSDETYADHTADASASVEARLDAQVNLEILRSALAKLTDKERDYLLARFADGMTTGILGEMFGIDDPSYAGRKAERLVEKLRRIFESENTKN